MTLTDAPPVPTGTYASWFPAAISHPAPADSQRVVWFKTRALLTDKGLFVYRTAPTDKATDGTPALVVDVDWSRTFRPLHSAMNGYDITDTDGGTWTLTATSDCGCGMALKYWQPSWATNVLAWGSVPA